MIVEVALRNWKSHGEKNGSYGSILSFERGLNVIYGVNGSGKSSIAEAIVYGLYGKAPSLKNVLRRGTQEGSVRIKLFVDKLYTIERAFTTQGSIDVKLIDEEGNLYGLEKQKMVNEIVKELLGMDEKLFLKAVYGEQNKILEIYEKRGKERAELLDDILGLKEYRSITDKLISIRNAIDRKVKNIDVAALLREKEKKKAEIKDIELEIEKTREDIQKLKTELNSKKDNLNKLKSELLEAEKEFEKAEELYKRFLSIESAIKTLKGEIYYFDVTEDDVKHYEELKERYEAYVSLKKELSSIQNVLKSLYERKKKLRAPGPSKRDSIEKELRRLEEEERNIRKLLINTKNTIVEVRNLLKEAEKEYDNAVKTLEEKKKLENELKTVERELQAILHSYERVLREYEEIKERVGILSFAHRLKEGICPLCENKVSKEIALKKIEEASTIHNTLHSLEEKLKELENRKDELEKKVIFLKHKLESMEVTEVDEKLIIQLREKLNSLEERERELENKLLKVEKEIEIYRKRYAEELEKEAILRELEELNDQIKSWERKLQHIESELSSIGEIDEKIVEEARKRKESFEKLRKLRALEKELNKLSSAVEEFLRIKDRVNHLRIEITQLEAYIERLSGDIRVLEERMNALLTKKDALEQELQTVEEALEDYRKFSTLRQLLHEMSVKWGSTLRIVREKRVETINKALKLIWSHVYASQYRDYTDIRFIIVEPEGRRVSTYTIEVKGDRWYDIDVLSGGERTLALLAFRIAVSFLLSRKAQFLILDEPTHNLDENITRKLAEFFSLFTRKGYFEQIILITHDPVFAEYADVVYHIERSKTGNDPAKVIRER